MVSRHSVKSGNKLSLCIVIDAGRLPTEAMMQKQWTTESRDHAPGLPPPCFSSTLSVSLSCRESNNTAGGLSGRCQLRQASPCRPQASKLPHACAGTRCHHGAPHLYTGSISSCVIALWKPLPSTVVSCVARTRRPPSLESDGRPLAEALRMTAQLKLNDGCMVGHASTFRS